VQRNLDLLDALVRLVDVRYETDQARRVDVLRVRMEQDRLNTRLRKLEDQRRPARARLNELLGREADAAVDVPTRLPDAPLTSKNGALPVADHDSGLGASADSLTGALLAVAVERDPSLKALSAEADGYRAARQVATKEGRPDFGLGVEVRGRDFGPMRMMDGGESVFAKASIRVPIFREKYRAQKRQAEANRERVRLEQDERRHRLATEIESLVADHRDATRRIALYREKLIPKAAQSLDILEEEYAGGRVDFDEVLAMQRRLLDYAVTLTDAQVTQHQLRAELQALVGSGGELPRAAYEE
jgi:Outer membrane protein